MTAYRHRLPQLDAPICLTDGGLETTLVYTDGFSFPTSPRSDCWRTR